MTDKELAVLGQLSPQDYLQFMQGVWAQVTVLTPGKLEVRESFSGFSGLLNELEALVIKELKPVKTIPSPTLRKLEVLREKMNNAFQKLEAELKSYDGLSFSELFNTHYNTKLV